MADKDFKVKNKLFVNGLSHNSGVILATNNNLDSHTTVPTQYGGTGTTQSPNAGQVLYSSAGTNYAPTDLSSLTISSSGGSTITAASASTKGLIIKGASSQTANLTEWQNDAGTVLAAVSSIGTIRSNIFANLTSGLTYIATNFDTNGIGIVTSSAAQKGLIVRGAASQTADLQQWQDSSGNVQAKINAYGDIYTLGGRIFRGSQDLGANVNILVSSSTQKGIVVQGASSQTANLQEWQNSSGTVNARIDAYGTFQNGTAGGYGAWINVQPAQASDKGIIIRGAASQTANLQEWQNSAGTVLARINAGGVIKSSILAGLTDGYSLIQFNYDTNGVGITTGAAAQKGLIIRGAASQTANLQEWQNSAGTLMAAVKADGSFRAGGFNGATKFLVDQFGTLSLGTDRNITGTPTYLFVQSQASSDIGAVVKGASGQTANLQEWQNSAGTVLASIASTGQINAGAGFYTDWAGVGTGRIGAAHLSVSSQYLGNIVSIFKGISGQTANLTEWQNSSGTVLTKVDSSGIVTATNGFITSASYKLANGIISLGYTNTYTATIGVVAGTPTNETTLIVKKKDSTETGNLQEWQNSAGTVLASISAAGNLTVQDLTVNGTTTTINSTTLTVDDKNIELASVASPTDTTADGAGITIKGATDKTFNWVQSTGAFTSSEPISTPALSVSGNSVSSNITLAAGKRYFVDTTSARTLTLPASPSLGDEIKIFDASGTAATNNITVARNGNKINGITDDAIIDVNQSSSVFVYTGATVGWRFD